MRILVLAPQPFFQERGTPIATKLLLQVLAQAGHELEVLAYHEGSDPGLPGVRLHRIAALPGIAGVKPGFSGKKLVCDLLMLFKAWSLARQGRFDMVHAVEEAAFMAWGLKALLGLPYVYDMDSSLAGQLMDKHPGLRPLAGLLSGLENRAVRHSRGVLAVCPSLRQQARAQVRGIPVACLEDVSLLQDASPAPEDQALAGMPGLKVMYVGNLEPYQGMDLLLEGFKAARGQGADLSLAVIGGAPGDVARYQAQADALGLGGRARFLGPRPQAQLGAYLAQADILASPRLQGDNTPMKIYSYLDSGKPVLATRLATHTQVMGEREAMLVEPEPADLARGLVLLAADPELRRELGRRGQRLVRRRHSLEGYRRKLLSFYAAVQRSLPLAPAAMGKEAPR